jgi:hypothetical protein
LIEDEMEFSAACTASASSGLKTEKKGIELGHELTLKDFERDNLICILTYGTKSFLPLVKLLSQNMKVKCVGCTILGQISGSLGSEKFVFTLQDQGSTIIGYRVREARGNCVR